MQHALVCHLLKIILGVDIKCGICKRYGHHLIGMSVDDFACANRPGKSL